MAGIYLQDSVNTTNLFTANSDSYFDTLPQIDASGKSTSINLPTRKL